jgi:hypothetical protein
MEGVAGLAASTILGGLTGVVGSFVNRGFGLLEMREKRQDRRLEIAHAERGWAHETTLHELQLRARAAETESELRLAEAALERATVEGSWAGLRASVQADGRVAASYPWVNAVRALVRPALTLLLWLSVLLLFALSLGGGLPVETAAEVVETAVQAVTYGAVTALAWWFGDRAPGRLKRE